MNKEGLTILSPEMLDKIKGIKTGPLYDAFGNPINEEAKNESRKPLQIEEIIKRLSDKLPGRETRKLLEMGGDLIPKDLDDQHSYLFRKTPCSKFLRSIDEILISLKYNLDEVRKNQGRNVSDEDKLSVIKQLQSQGYNNFDIAA